MRNAIGLFAIILTMSQMAFAADIFVKETTGINLSGMDAQKVTDAVKRSVDKMPEHKLVDSEDQADFVLQPSVLERSGQTVLRLERIQEGETISISEQPLPSEGPGDRQYTAATEQVLDQENMESRRGIASQEEPMIDGDTASGTTGDMTGEKETLIPRLEPGEGVAGEVRGPSPRFREDRGTGYFSIGLGPSVAIGLDSDNVMTNVNIGYNIDFFEQLSGRAFGDFNLGTGSDTARFINWGIGADWYPTTQELAIGTPYVSGNLGYAFVRNQSDDTEGGPTIGAAGGFKFQAAQLNWDINLNYTLFADDLAGSNPSIIGLRAAVNF